MTKRVLIYANELERSKQIKEDLLAKLADTAIEVVDEHTVPDYIVSIGGDGTLLSAFHTFKHYLNAASFIGIHTGHLGFYTDWLDTELDEVVAGIERADGESTSYPLLEVVVHYEDGKSQRKLALNELALRTPSGTVVCDVYIKDYFFETTRGDGICVATPTGSTGLNKSHGGGIIHPRLDAIQLTEMGSINNRVYRSIGSPVIIPRDEWIVLCPKDTDSVVYSIDNMSFHEDNIKEMRVQVASERIRFASFRHMHFWDRVENAFIGAKRQDKKRD
ncbi:NAD kinase [Suicoccus acidiformans]|uniref:NAD kinase n=1 Tax=Suicoccus acidiformans TaxID=2036206 RepID=A0A347WJ83_9LACT|nr:NAD kinase [Suicoccus acidiformans]AXY25140.1 NAD kinase [Suicoccus acidiformans]